MYVNPKMILIETVPGIRGWGESRAMKGQFKYCIFDTLSEHL
jgi:hypothetical protein